MYNEILNSAMAGFLNYIRVEKRYSVRTVELYRDAITRFYHSTADDNTVAGIKELFTKNNIRNHIVSLSQDGVGARSINLHISALSSFCKYLVNTHNLSENPVATVRRPKVKRRLPHFFVEEEINRVSDQLSADFLTSEADNIDDNAAQTIDNEYKRERDALIVIMLYATGLRRAELASLKTDNFDSGRQVLRIVGKGNKMREIPVVQYLYDKILVYLQTREKRWPDINSNAFFLTNKGQPLYLQFVNKVVRDELKSFDELHGVKTPHVLRHTIATALLNDGADINSIKEVLGHASLAATQVYTHNSFEKLRKIYITAHPRAKKGG